MKQLTISQSAADSDYVEIQGSLWYKILSVAEMTTK